MGQFSTYAQNEILDHILKVGAFTQPTHLYIGLSRANPLADGSGIDEPSGGSYARKICDDWNIASQRKTKNAIELVFTEATGAWGTLTHWFISDALTGGNMIAFGALVATKTGATGDDFSIKIGDCEISFKTGKISTYLANKILDHVFMNSAYTPPANIYCALATETIYDADTGLTITEPTTGGYGRINHNTWNIASAGASSNDGAISFAEPSASQGIASDVALIDALTAGNMLIYGELDNLAEINAGDTPFRFADEALDITLT